MRKNFTCLLVCFLGICLVAGPDIKNLQELKEKYPHLVKFTGEYEFYLDERYQVVQIHIEKGKLVGARPGSRPVIFSPVKTGAMTFTGNEPDNPSRISFTRDQNGKISSIRWKKGKENLFIPRKIPYRIMERYPVDQLRQDFRQFKNHLISTFPQPYEFISSKDFGQLLQERYQRIEQPMNLQEFYTLLVPLKAKIGCGHAHLDYPSQYRQNFKFPLILKFIRGKCYLVKDLSVPQLIPRFSEILTINGTEISRIIRILKGDISADGYNDHYKTSALANCFQYYYANRYGTPEKYSIHFLPAEGIQAGTVNVAAIPCRRINYSNKKYGKLEFSILPLESTAIMRVTSFIYYGKKNKIFFSFIDKSFKKVKEKGIRHLIIDLRGNDGGDPFCAAYLLSYVLKRPAPYFAHPYGRYARLAKPVSLAKNRFSGKLYFMIDGSGFSTTGHFCALLKYHKLGTFTGSETGGTYTCNAAVRRIQLKNTRILLKIARSSFQAAVTGLPKNRGIIPDFTVRADIRDLKNNRDPVLHFTLNLIRKRLKNTAGTE